jgi:hypothetical protein
VFVIVACFTASPSALRTPPVAEGTLRALLAQPFGNVLLIVTSSASRAGRGVHLGDRLGADAKGSRRAVLPGGGPFYLAFAVVRIDAVGVHTASTGAWC